MVEQGAYNPFSPTIPLFQYSNISFGFQDAYLLKLTP